MNKYCDLETFENCVIKKNENKEYLYILSNQFYYYHDQKFLINISIFDNLERGTVKDDKKKVEEILKILKTKDSPEEKTKKLKSLNITEEEKKGIGIMLGMAIGDAMGARYEFNPVNYDTITLEDMGHKAGGNFRLQPGQWTDDTSMGLCLADSLLMNKGNLDQHDLMHRFVAWIIGGYNNAFRFNKKNNLPLRGSVGLGGNISLSIDNYIDCYNKNKELKAETDAGDKNTSGNGSIMRNAAIPICFHDNIELACEEARRQSLVTHQGIEAEECCSLLTHIIVKLFGKNELKDVLENLGKDFKTKKKSVEYLAKSMKEENDEDKNWNWKINGQYKYSPYRTYKSGGYIGSYAMDAMAMSLNILYNTNSFRNAIIKAVNIRGDSDSVASVVGQIAGAYYPIEYIPGDWIEAIYKWDAGEIALRGYMLARLKKGDSFIIK